MTTTQQKNIISPGMSSLDKTEDPLKKICMKYNPLYKKFADIKEAICYIKLKDLGCPKKKALTFSNKNVCRIDVT